MSIQAIPKHKSQYPKCSERFHLFQHIWPLLRPLPLDHLHNDAWQSVFNMTLLLQDGICSLMKYIKTSCMYHTLLLATGTQRAVSRQGCQIVLVFIFLRSFCAFVLVIVGMENFAETCKLCSVLTLVNISMVQSFKWTFSCCGMLFHWNLVTQHTAHRCISYTETFPSTVYI